MSVSYETEKARYYCVHRADPCNKVADAEAFCLPGGRLGTAVGSTAPTLDATWAGTLTSRQLRMATIRTGTLRALGVGLDLKKPAPDPDGVPTRPMPACNFCEFGRLCGAEPMV